MANSPPTQKSPFGMHPPPQAPQSSDHTLDYTTNKPVVEPTPHRSTSDVDAYSLLGEMEQRQNMFSQLNQFVAQMQTETQSVDVWRKKLKELDELRSEKNQLTSALHRAGEQIKSLRSEAQTVTRSNEGLQRDMETLNGAILAAQQHNATLTHTNAQLEASVSGLRGDVERAQSVAKTNEMLSHTIDELNGQIASLKVNFEKRLTEAKEREQTHKESAEKATKDKNDLNRHFWNMTEDVKVLKDELAKHITAQKHSQHTIQTLTHERDALTKTLHTAQAQSHTLRTDFDAKLREAEEARQAVEAQLSTFHSAGVSSVEALRDLQSEVVRAKAQCSELLQAQSDTEEKQKSVLGDVQRLQGEKDTLKDTVQELHRDRERMEAHTSQLQESNTLMKEELSAALEECDTLREHMHSYTAKQLSDANTIQTLRSELAAHESTLKRERADAKKAKSHADTLSSSHKSTLSDLQKKLDAALAQHRQALAESERAAQAHDTAEQNYANIVNKLKAELDKRCTELGECNGTIEKLREQVRTFEDASRDKDSAHQAKETENAQAFARERNRLANECKNLLVKLKTCETDKREALHEITSLTQTMSQLKNDLGDKGDECAQLQREKESALEECERLKGARKELLDELKGSEATHAAQVASLNDDIAKLREDVSSRENNVKQLKKGEVLRVAELNESMEKLRDELRDMASNKQLLEERMTHLQLQVENSNAVIESLNAKLTESEQQSHHKLHELTDQIASYETANTRMKEMVDAKSSELMTLTNQLKQVSAQMRDVREGKRVAEVRVGEVEAALVEAQRAMQEAKAEADRLRAAKVVVEETNHKLKHSLKQMKHNMQALETTGNTQIMATKKTMDELRRRCEVSEDQVEDLRMQNDKLELEVKEITTTSQNHINSLMSQIKQQDASMKSERDKVRFDMEALRAQMNEVEREKESSESKFKSSITHTREEADRHRKLVYELQSTTSELKVQLESVKREVESKNSALASLESVKADLEKRLERSREQTKTANRNAEAARAERDAASMAARRAEELNIARLSGRNEFGGDLGSELEDSTDAALPQLSATSTGQSEDRAVEAGLDADTALKTFDEIHASMAHEALMHSSTARSLGASDAAVSRPRQRQGRYSNHHGESGSPNDDGYDDDSDVTRSRNTAHTPMVRNVPASSDDRASGGTVKRVTLPTSSAREHTGAYAHTSSDDLDDEIQAHMRARQLAIANGELEDDEDSQFVGGGSGAARGAYAQSQPQAQPQSHSRAPLRDVTEANELNASAALRQGQGVSGATPGDHASSSIEFTANFLQRRRTKAAKQPPQPTVSGEAEPVEPHSFGDEEENAYNDTDLHTYMSEEPRQRRSPSRSKQTARSSNDGGDDAPHAPSGPENSHARASQAYGAVHVHGGGKGKRRTSTKFPQINSR